MPKLSIRFGWLPLIALSAQLLVIYVGFGDLADVRRFIFPLSYVLLLAFVLLNWRRIGLLIIGIGAFVNFLPIVANGGLMPISPDTMVEAGLERELADLEIGEPVPDTKNVLLEEGDTYLQPLTDRLTWEDLGPFPVFSIGDIIVLIGLAVFVLELLWPAIQRGPRNTTSAT